MPMTVTPNEDDMAIALRSFLLGVVPTEMEIVQAQNNRVPQPKAQSYILITPLRRTRLGTNETTHDTYDQVNSARQPTQFDFQVDAFGETGGDVCQIVTTLMRDEYAVEWFRLNHPAVSPLYANDPRQMPFTDGEDQYEDRWIIEVSLQADTLVTFPQQSATELEIGIKSVEVEFPAL